MFEPTVDAVDTTKITFAQAKTLLKENFVLFYPGHSSMPGRVEFRATPGQYQIRDEEYEHDWQDYDADAFLEELEDSCSE